MMYIPSLKSVTKQKPIEKLASPSYVYLSLKDYRQTMTPLVKVGDHVKKYQKIASSTGIFAGSVHASISGEVVRIELDKSSPQIIIKNDFTDTCIPLQKFDVNQLSKEEILEIIRDYGIVGSGGARFPTHTKYTINNQSITHLIINGAECEPYLSADYALLKNESTTLLKAISIVQKAIQAEKVVIGIEKQHKELKAHLLKKASELKLPISIKLLANTYPQGGELQLIKSVTKKELAKGSIPAEHGVIVNNVGTLWAIGQAFFEGKPYIERVITLSGKKVKNIGNYLVPIGISIEEILKQTNMEWHPTKQTIILGGPMMGKAVEDANTPIHKGSGGVLVIPKPTNNRFNCIQCGYCSDVCPQKLMPMEFARNYAENDPINLKENALNDCIECGACAYICPSDVPLMRSIVEGKKILQTL